LTKKTHGSSNGQLTKEIQIEIETAGRKRTKI